MDYDIIREKDGICVLIVNGERYFSGTYMNNVMMLNAIYTKKVKRNEM